DEFEFHEKESVSCHNAIHAGIDDRIDCVHGASGAREDVRWRIGKIRSSPKIVLHPEVAGLRLLQDGVTEFASEEDERPFAFGGDAVNEFLQHNAGAAVEFVKEWLGGGGICLRDELGAVGGGRDTRLDDGFAPAEFAEFLS